uniref:E3 ubiquitin-protein ligase TRIM31 n=1 Tax=Catagonus wagneri TaxID=51154 RepID=A0A8C3W9R8_9CETA
MAGQQFANRLQEEVICSICMDILQDPATINCGHSFCLGCITRSGEASDSVLKCPLCNKIVKRDTIRPNWLLMSLVEKIQAMDPSEIQPEAKERKCLKHGEKFHYFCESDGKFLCVVCRGSKDHKFHNTTLLEEAAQSFQGQIQSQVEALLQKERAIVQMKLKGEERFNAQVEQEKQKISTAFKQLQRALKEEKNFLLSRISWLDQELAKERKCYVTSAEAQLHSLRKLKDSLKARQLLPPSQMLQFILLRSAGFRFLSPPPVSIDLEKKFNEARLRHESLTDNLKKFQDKLQADGKKDKTRFLKGMDKHYIKSWYLSEKNNPKMIETLEPESSPPDDRRANPLPPKLKQASSIPNLFRSRSRASIASFVSYSNEASYDDLGSPGAEGTDELEVALTPVTLDAASAHPDLVISQDLKTVTLDPVPQSCCAEPTDPARFHPFRCALGLPGLSSGCQTWEAELEGPEGGGCVVGVASELVTRRGPLVIEPLTGFWVLRIAGSECQALTEGGTREELSVRPRKVRVRVNHECGEVVFSDSTTSSHIYTFHTSFPGHIFPFFRLLFPGTQITLSP